jgi:hypothetical protein
VSATAGTEANSVRQNKKRNGLAARIGILAPGRHNFDNLIP